MLVYMVALPHGWCEAPNVVNVLKLSQLAVCKLRSILVVLVQGPTRIWPSIDTLISRSKWCFAHHYYSFFLFPWTHALHVTKGLALNFSIRTTSTGWWFFCVVTGGYIWQLAEVGYPCLLAKRLVVNVVCDPMWAFSGLTFYLQLKRSTTWHLLFIILNLRFRWCRFSLYSMIASHFCCHCHLFPFA